MNNLRLRVSVDMHEGILEACENHNHDIASFCRRVAKQIISGRIIVKNVVKKKKKKYTTKYKIISVDDWQFQEVKGKKLKAGIQIALNRLQSVPVTKKPLVSEIEGIDYVLTT